MAGIAGFQGTESGELDRMLERIKHRGPHETWRMKHENLSLGCCELNLGGNAKPGAHFAAEGSRAAVVDGRLYNDEMSGMTEAETVLRFYGIYGPGFAKMLDGDFVCAISDQGKLVMARDAAGIKPLYYGHANGSLCFASEAKGLVGVAYDVKEFPPGYVYSEQLGFQKYGSQEVETPEYEDYEQAKRVVKELLLEATERRMKDDSVGGILLSGGLDSSIISYLSHQIKPDIEAFTVSMEEGQDLPLARDVVKHVGIKHHVLIFGEKEINEILPTAVYHQEMFEESCIHGAIANYLAAQFVKSHTNCVLTGEGADEFFSGYDGQYKQTKNPAERAAIVDRLIQVAYNTALQRLDRLVAANSVETRTPFLDTKVMDFCMKIPLASKINGEDQTGKWILRQAFEGCLPDHIIYQTKRFFAQGSGVAGIMRNLAEQHITENELKEHNSQADKPHLSSVEELYYYRMFKQSFPDPAYDRLVGRWDPFRPDFFLR